MKKKRKNVMSGGIINGLLNYLSDKILTLAKNGFFGKLFSSDLLESTAAQGIVAGNADDVASGAVGDFRRKNLRLANESIFLNSLRRAKNYFLSSGLNWYGVYFISFAFYSLLIYVVKNWILEAVIISPSLLLGDNFIIPILIMIAAVPLARCTDSLGSAVYKSGLIRPILESFGGVPENKFEECRPVNTATGYFMAITLGILSGGVTYFTSSLNVLWVIFAIFAISLITALPEVGVIITVFIFPFLGLFEHPSAVLVAIVLVDILAYLSKVFVGKRVFRLRLMDIAVAIFAILTLMGGVITSGGLPSLKSAVMYFVLMAIYFLIVNLFNTREWIERLVAAVAIPSVLVSIYGILGYAANHLPAKWLDTSMFFGITNRAVSVFENPNMLATYLALTIPFILVCVLNKKLSVKTRVFSLCGFIVSLACIILTWSRGAWLGLIVAIALFSLIVYKHSLKYWLAVGITAPFWSKLIPDNVMTRFMSIGDLADSSTYYRLYTWKGALRLFSDYWFSGIGVGDAAFTQVYPLYAYIGIESTVHSHNLFLQIAIELGIMGLIVFLAIMLLTVQKGFWGLKNTHDPNVKLFIAAGLSGLVAALVHGMVDYIWYNYRVFFAFWIVVALVRAGSEIAEKERLSADTSVFGMREKASSLDIIFG